MLKLFIPLLLALMGANLLFAPSVLVDAPRNAGEHAVMWDGRDEAGRSVSSGVYFARMQAGNYSKTQKMLYAR